LPEFNPKKYGFLIPTIDIIIEKYDPITVAEIVVFEILVVMDCDPQFVDYILSKLKHLFEEFDDEDATALMELMLNRMDEMNFTLSTYKNKRFEESFISDVIELVPHSSETLYNTILEKVLKEEMTIVRKAIYSKYLLNKYMDKIRANEPLHDKLSVLSEIYFHWWWVE